MINAQKTLGRTARALSFVAALLSGGCKCSPEAASVPPKSPTIRLYLVSSAAGALEPCGCVKDMLGGVDHLAAFVKSQNDDARASLMLGAGPLFFMNTELVDDRRTQESWKADALSRALGVAGLRAWAPGANDWAAGSDTFAALAGVAGATPLAANLSGPANTLPIRTFDVGGYKVGVAGVSEPSLHGKLPAGVTSLGARDVDAVTSAKAQLDAAGARVRVLLAAMPRGDALRLTDKVPGFQLLVIGKPFDQGETNDLPTPPELVGKTLVVEAPNHLQAVAIVDFFVRGDGFDFADGSNLAGEAERESLGARIHELETLLAAAKQSGKEQDPDVRARARDLDNLRGQLKALEKPRTPVQSSFFQYRLVDVRDNLGSEPTAHALIDGYYKRVNEHNRDAFKDKLPVPAAAGEASYAGIEACTKCHTSERRFWDSTQHAHAYVTLSSQNKEFNLDCVGCHVTGYDKPGGTNVTHVENLKDVQCETCHGAGSKHVATPREAKLGFPEQSLCAGTCHHPPHVKPNWDVTEAWKKIIGTGHGL
ncbi:MAG TPA: multiheme c-type cytochrome [Polyangiaceae bacterium]